MSVEWVRVVLRAWKPDGKRVPDDAFIKRLLITPSDPIVKIEKGKAEQAARVTLVFSSLEEFLDADEPREAFVNTVASRLREAGKWLARQPSIAFKQMRKDGLELDVFIGAWIEGDQLDLDLPPEFTRACGKHMLPISIITND